MPTLHLPGGHAWKLVFDSEDVEFVLEIDPGDPHTLKISTASAPFKPTAPTLKVAPGPSSGLEAEPKRMPIDHVCTWTPFGPATDRPGESCEVRYSLCGDHPINTEYRRAAGSARD
jgi:hypothetical protein